MSGDQAVAMAGAERSNVPPSTFGGEAMFGKLGEDFILTLALRLNFDTANWGFGVQLPVRLRIIDREPEQPNDFAGILRREDWDEPSDFLRIIRYAYVGQPDKKGPFYVRVGELSGTTVGHGTIVYRYYNGVDLDVWHTGFNGALNIDAFGAEAIVGDVIDPYIVGGRFTVRPLQLAMAEGDDETFFWSKLVVGASVISDLRAPYALQTTGSATVSPSTETIALDADKHPIVTGDRALTIIGFDVGLEVFSNDLFSVTPYVDLNKMTVVDDGWGLHVGVLWGLRFPLLIDTLTFDARTEYRRVSGDYVGPYINTPYEIERYQTLGTNGGLPLPKLRALALGDTPSRNGIFLDLLAGLPNFVFIGGEYTDYDGGIADGTLRLSLEVPALEVFRLSAFYYRINISGTDDMFKLDDRSAIVAAVSIPLYSIFTANVRWWRVWQADPSSNGRFQAVDDWSVGFGFSLAL